MEYLEKLTDVAGNIEAARKSAMRALVMCRSIPELKEFRDKAEAVQVYCRTRDEAKEASIIASELKIRAERQIGVLIQKLPRGQKTVKGISISSRGRWQKLAEIPETEFEKEINERKKKGKPIFADTFLMMHKEINGFKPHPQNAAGCRKCDKMAMDLKVLIAATRRFIISHDGEWSDELTMLAKLVGVVKTKTQQTAEV